MTPGRIGIAGRPLTLTLSPEGRGSDGAPAVQSASPLPAGERVRVRGAKLSAGKVVRARRLRQQETAAEHRLWNMLRDRRFQGLKFVRQYPVGRYVADFVCRERMLIIEVDGGQHAESATDEVRTAFLNGRGYGVLRFWNNEVLTNIEGCWQVLNEIALGIPSPDRRFAPATLSPEGRGDPTATLARDE